MANRATSNVPYERLATSLRKGDVSPLYLFYGEEDLLIEEAVESVIAASIDEATKSFNLDIVYGSDAEGKQISSLASTFPMMAERRVVVVREFDKLSDKDSLLPYLDHPSASTSLVLVTTKPDFRQKLYKEIREKGVAVEFKPLHESDIPAWINKKVERPGKHISIEACQLMQSYLGRSLREIQNEIDKLLVYVGDRSTIEVNDINALVGKSRLFNVYELQNALGTRNISRSLEILEHMLDAGEQPIGIIVMLTRYIQKLWVIQDCINRKMSDQAMASILNISPKATYFLIGDKRAAGRFTSTEIEGCFGLLREADERLKTSNGDVKLVMTLLLYHMLKGEHSYLLGS